MPPPLTRSQSNSGGLFLSVELAASAASSNAGRPLHSSANAATEVALILDDKGGRSGAASLGGMLATESGLGSPRTRGRVRARSPAATLRAENKRRFTSLTEAGGARWVAPAQTQGRELQSGLFNLMDDECLAMVMQYVVMLTEAHGIGMEFTTALQRDARSLTALLRSCKRMFSVYCTIGARLRREMAARAISHIRPLLSAPYPFTVQVQEQGVSSRSYRVLKESMERMALHCAGECCGRERKAVARALAKRNVAASIQPIEQRTTLLSVGDAGDAAFICCRRRVPKTTLRHSRSHELISHVRFSKGGQGSAVHGACLHIDAGEMSSPYSLVCNADATKAAFIRTLHTVSNDETIPHSVAFVWSIAVEESAIVTPPFDAEECGAINVQAAWWLADGRLALLWSTAYVSPIGSVVGASADTACYLIATYRVEEDGSSELDTFVGPFSGKAKEASASRDGETVAIIVRKPPVGHGPGSLAVRATVVHNVFSESSYEVDHVVRSHHPHDRTVCPSSIGLSPNGDCLVAVHATPTHVAVEVLIKTAPTVFVSVQSIDVTHWTRSPLPLEEPGTLAEWGDEIRLPYAIHFSPCGRFVSILDKRTSFGMAPPNHALIILDTALRNAPRGVRATPLAPTREVAPRSLAWTKNGLWMQAAHGAVRVWSE